MAGGALRELLAFFGVEVEGTEKLEHADSKMDELAEKAQKVGEILGEAFAIHEVAEFISGQIEMGAQLAHTSEILGLSIGDLQAFQYAAENAGLGADEANISLRFLNKTMGEALDGQAEAQKSFTKLGVVLKDAEGRARPVQDVLADVADGFAALPSPAERTAAAMGIFGRSGAQLIPLLNKGSKGINQLYSEFVDLGEGMNEDFIKSAEESEHQMIRLKTASKGLESTISAALLPTITDLADWVTKVVVGFREMTSSSYIVEDALWTLAGVSAVLAGLWAAANVEVLLVVLGLALLLLAVDDVVTFFRGGQSLIGDFFDSLGGAGTQDDVRAFFKHLWVDLQDIKDTVETELVPALGRLWAAATNDEGKKTMVDFKIVLHDAAVVADALAEAMRAVAHYAAMASDALAEVESGKGNATIDRVGRAAGLPTGVSGSQLVKGGFGGFGHLFSGAGVGSQAIQLAQIKELATTVIQGADAQYGGDVHSHVEVNNTFHGPADPKAVGQATGDSVDDAMDQVIGQAFRSLVSGGGH